MTENEAIEELQTAIELAKMCTQNLERKREIQGYEMAIKALEEVQEYRAIGTLEECRAAMKKQTARKVTTNHSWTHYHFFCPVCNMEVNDMKYCPNCGQKLDWSDEE